MKKIIIIDNYDSFTYNLVHYLEDLNAAVTVYRNDEFDIDELQKFDKILLSPGPGVPKEAGLLFEVIKTGVCLGQQAIAEVFGGSLINLDKVHHGVSSSINIVASDEPMFQNLETTIDVGRYHSWVVNPADFPEVLEITSIDENNQIMSLRHRILDVRGVQFHPESLLTPNGKQILENWLNIQ